MGVIFCFSPCTLWILEKMNGLSQVVEQNWQSSKHFCFIGGKVSCVKQPSQADLYIGNDMFSQDFFISIVFLNSNVVAVRLMKYLLLLY